MRSGDAVFPNHFLLQTHECRRLVRASRACRRNWLQGRESCLHTARSHRSRRRRCGRWKRRRMSRRRPDSRRPRCAARRPLQCTGRTAANHRQQTSPRCATHDKYSLVFIVQQNLAGISAVWVVFYRRLDWIEQGLTSHQTHYGSYRGRVFTGQMTQPTVSKH